MIEVRSALTAELLGYVPGLIGLNRVGSYWRMQLTATDDALFYKVIDLPVAEFRDNTGWRREWACLNSDGFDLDTLRQIFGWRDAP